MTLSSLEQKVEKNESVEPNDMLSVIRAMKESIRMSKLMGDFISYSEYWVTQSMRDSSRDGTSGDPPVRGGRIIEVPSRPGSRFPSVQTPVVNPFGDDEDKPVPRVPSTPRVDTPSASRPATPGLPPRRPENNTLVASISAKTKIFDPFGDNDDEEMEHKSNVTKSTLPSGGMR